MQRDEGKSDKRFYIKNNAFLTSFFVVVCFHSCSGIKWNFTKVFISVI